MGSSLSRNCLAPHSELHAYGGIPAYDQTRRDHNVQNPAGNNEGFGCAAETMFRKTKMGYNAAGNWARAA
eukprot:1163690-Lingulodinium_polyedra.AAC.1